MRQSVSDYWLEFNRPLEGRVNYMYLDVRGYVSTGVGNLIDATKKARTAPTDAERAASLVMAGDLKWLAEKNGPRATAQQIADTWDLVKSRMDLASRGGGAYRLLTKLYITEEEIDRFVGVRLSGFERFLKGRREFATFGDWPADAQLALLSMAWALGPKFRFPKFQAFVAAGDWEGAATECRFNPDKGTIIKRNDLNQQLFRNAARVQAEHLDPEVLLLTGSAGSRPQEPIDLGDIEDWPETNAGTDAAIDLGDIEDWTETDLGEIEDWTDEGSDGTDSTDSTDGTDGTDTSIEPSADYDVDTAEGLYAALELLGVTPDGLDDASLAAACDVLRMNLGLEPTGDTEPTDDARAFVRDQVAASLSD